MMSFSSKNLPEYSLCNNLDYIWWMIGGCRNNNYRLDGAPTSIMKTTIPLVWFSLVSILAFSQNIIHHDTVINKTINLNETFELKFLDWPGTGYTWYLPVKCDSTKVNIRLLKQKVMVGYLPVGGKWVSTYQYAGLIPGTYLLEYYYGRSWEKEKLNTCIINLTIK
jgi:predicted secreted protein